MTKTNNTTAEQVLVAIDISKSRQEILIALPGKKRRKKLTILSNKEDYDRLTGYLTSLKAPVQIGFEATGNYHRTLAWRLHQAGFELRLISSVSMARTREALYNSWDKNDPKDAQVLLYMLALGQSQRFYDPLVEKINDIQEVSKTHEIVSKAKTELWHRIQTHYLPLYFPEAERYKNRSRSGWLLAFLEAFPTPHSITCHSKAAFSRLAWDVVGRKVSKQLLLNDIYETACSSIGLPVPLDSTAIIMFRMVLREALGLIAQRDEIERQAKTLLGDHPDFIRLQQIPGIGPINALTILAEAGDLRRFKHHRQFLKFCGMDLSTQQSGTFRGQSKLSKYGNARLRRTFWLAGQVAVKQKENSFKDKFNRYIKRDRSNRHLRRKAYTAVAAKVARVAHAVIKSDADYRPFYEAAMPDGRTSLCRAVEASR